MSARVEAAAVFEDREPVDEPRRERCAGCTDPVLVAVIEGRRVIADIYEWEPRARCFMCARTETRGQRRVNCDRCGGSGYTGEKRPPGEMLAIDIAWSDEGHVRIVGPATSRKRGEALYRLHSCSATT